MRQSRSFTLETTSSTVSVNTSPTTSPGSQRWKKTGRERTEEEEEEKEKLELEKLRDEKLNGGQKNLGLSIQEEDYYHLNDEVTLLNENPDIFRKAPRRDEPEEVEERKGKRQRFASNRMENEDDKD